MAVCSCSPLLHVRPGQLKAPRATSATMLDYNESPQDTPRRCLGERPTFVRRVYFFVWMGLWSPPAPCSFSQPDEGAISSTTVSERKPRKWWFISLGYQWASQKNWGGRRPVVGGGREKPQILGKEIRGRRDRRFAG